MKQWFAYLVIFSITLLTVPRNWIHECDHDHHIESSDSTSDDHQDCFVCELDLETGTVFNFSLFDFINRPITQPLNSAVRSIQQPASDLFDSRGPPASC